MKILSDGSLYVEKGEPMPFKCPECGTYAPWVPCAGEIVCDRCSVNGITQEALLAIVIDRLRSFQAGPFACIENQQALDRCESALTFLQKRTVARIKRGVEGTTQK